jgi:hypothetical protein
MNIATLNLGAPAGAQTAMGHAVLELHLGRGVHCLLPHLGDFRPDLFIQMEHLGFRCLCSDLPALPCVKAFWSIDTHINLYWQHYYARLFDVLLTPHPSFVRELPEAFQPPQLRRLPWWGTAMPWRAHAQRAHDINFVGRMHTTDRPLRSLLGALLRAGFGVNVREGLSFPQLLELYADTRLLPNESLAMETNFRLLEGASAGCCLLTQAVGEDQNAVLDPGAQCLIYEDGLELVDLLRMGRAHPALAERIGLAAYRRIQADHLPGNRAAVLADLARAPRHAQTGAAAEHALYCALAHTARGGAHGARDAGLYAPFADKLAALLPRLENEPALWTEALAACLQMAHESQRRDRLEELSRLALHMPDRPYDLPAFLLYMTAFASAAITKDVELARGFVARHAAKRRELPPFAHGDAPTAPDAFGASDPGTLDPGTLCLAWADDARALGLEIQLGLLARPETHCPGSAFEMILLAGQLGASPKRCSEAIIGLSAIQKHAPHTLTGGLSRLVLEDDKDWRLRVRLAMADLRCYRVREGLEELYLAVGQSGGEPDGSIEREMGTGRAPHILHSMKRLLAG